MEAITWAVLATVLAVAVVMSQRHDDAECGGLRWRVDLLEEAVSEMARAERRGVRDDSSSAGSGCGSDDLAPWAADSAGPAEEATPSLGVPLGECTETVWAALVGPEGLPRVLVESCPAGADPDLCPHLRMELTPREAVDLAVAVRRAAAEAEALLGATLDGVTGDVEVDDATGGAAAAGDDVAVDTWRGARL